MKIGELYLNGGRWQGRQIVPAAWVAGSTSPQLTPEQGTDGQYGYFWWVVDAPPPPLPAGFQASGAYFQRVDVIPSRRVVIVVTAADGGADDLDAAVVPILRQVVVDPLLR